MMELLVKLPNATGNKKSKIAASKLEIRLSQLVHKIYRSRDTQKLIEAVHTECVGIYVKSYLLSVTAAIFYFEHTALMSLSIPTSFSVLPQNMGNMV